MAKNKVLTFLILIATLLTACSTKESLQRDLIVGNEIPFDVAASTNLLDTMLLSQTNVSSDLNGVITENTGNLNASNLSSVKLALFTIDLKSEEVDGIPQLDTVNNLQAFDYIRVQIKSNTEKLLNIGSINSSNIQSASTLQLPLTDDARQDLVKYFSDGTLTYIITGVNGKETTQIRRLTAKAVYKLTLKI